MYQYINDIINKYNNLNHGVIKMKPVNVKSSTYIDFDKDKNNGVSCKNIKIKKHFDCIPNWSEEVFITAKAKNTASQTYVNGKDIVGIFHEKRIAKIKSSKI